MKLGYDTHDRSNSRRILRISGTAILIGLAVNVFITIFLDRGRIIESLRGIRLKYIAVPFLLFIAGHVVDSIRLTLVLSQFGVRTNARQAFYNSAVGTFFTNITPMAAGGQAFQIHHLRSIDVGADTATNVIMSRFVEQVMTSALILIAFVPQILSVTRSLRIGAGVIYAALGLTVVFTFCFLLLLIRPRIIGRTALVIERTAVGRLIGKVSRRRSWAPRVYRWSRSLRENVRFLWGEKLHIMLLDILLGIGVLMLHAYSLFFVLRGLASPDIHYLAVLVTYEVLWQVVFYVPTPGASGGVEGTFALVYAEMTGAPEATLISVIVWRLATYYLLILFGGLLYGLFAKAGYAKTGRAESAT